jgi:hypothetical protein
MTIDFYKMRIDAIRDASSRSRWVFAAATIASLTQIGATWNASMSWLRGFPLSMRSFGMGPPGVPADEVVAALQRSLMQQWVESQFITVPLLGLKFCVADASIVGSVALTVISIWLFYSLRRENHVTGQTFRDVADEGQELKAFVYHGVASTQVFATLSQNDEPMYTIETSRSQSRRRMFGIRRASRALVYLPAIAIALVIVSDFYSLFRSEAIFRYDHTPIAQQTDKLGNLLLHALPRDVFAALLCIVTIQLLRRTSRFQDGTMALLRQADSAGWSETPAEPQCSGPT